MIMAHVRSKLRVGLLVIYLCISPWFSLALAQYSGDSSGTGESDKQSSFLPDFSVPPIPYYIYGPVLVVVFAVLVCACIGWSGCCVLCCKYKRYRKVGIHKEGQEEIERRNVFEEELQEIRVTSQTMDHQGRATSDEVMRRERVTVVEVMRDDESSRATVEEHTRGDDGEGTDNNQICVQEPQIIPSTNPQPPPETSVATNHHPNFASPTEYSSNSLPTELTASGRQAVSPPASTLPGHGTHSVKELRPVYREQNGEVVQIRKAKRRTPAQSSSYQEESTENVRSKLTEANPPRRHSSTGQETYPAQRSSIGHGDVFESLERVRATMKPKNSTQNQSMQNHKKGKETSV